jgi:hypothetical protein
MEADIHGTLRVMAVFQCADLLALYVLLHPDRPAVLGKGWEKECVLDLGLGLARE